jgi:hypothetical protein
MLWIADTFTDNPPMVPVTIDPNEMMQLPPLSLNDECAQLKTAYKVCKRLGVPTLSILISLHEIEDGY